MDPISQGSEILLNIFNRYKHDKITDLEKLEGFLSMLLKEFKGLIIFDFMDSGCWDYFGSFEITDDGYLTLNWNYYSGENEYDSFFRNSEFLERLDSILLKFKELRFYKHEKYPFVTLRGYALKHKEIKNFLKNKHKDASIDYIPKARFGAPNFYDEYEVTGKNGSYDYHCYNTPIFSILIVPKDSAGPSVVSVKQLFWYNFVDCADRLNKVIELINNTELDEDEICEKSNTVRRIMEYLLKVECCFHSEFNFDMTYEEKEGKFTFTKDYSDLKLGDLTKIIKPVKNDAENLNLNLIIRLSNELSHDSGKLISVDNLKKLTNLVGDYIENLLKLI